MTGSGSRQDVVVIGGGPAGLTAAHELVRGPLKVTVLEAHPGRWGGISRTEEHGGYRFDIGGHRFFSKSAEIEALWDEILPEPLLSRPRKSRIFYGGKFYSYPIRPVEALFNLGPATAARCLASYARARLRPVHPVRSFEDWVVNAFGRRLFEIFFRTYTEKVWGMPCREISADWAAQRIRGLSLGRAITNALPRRRKPGTQVKTLIDSFRYPRLGPGMMWDAAANRVAAAGGRLVQGAMVMGLERLDGEWAVRATLASGDMLEARATDVISSMPLRALVEAVSPAAPPAVREAASGLRYRDFLTVALIVKERELFDDNWIYVHDPSVRVGRIQNFKSWSPALVPDPATACLGLEYFCLEGDGLWASPDDALVALAAAELRQLGLLAEGDLIEGVVVRQPKAYPVYDETYERRVATIRAWLEESCPGLHVIGRNGMHKYNNQDHAMMTALIVARNIAAGRQLRDPWLVNEDAEYHEERRGESASGLRDVPRRLA